MNILDQSLETYDLVSDLELRRAAAKTLKGFCATCLPHHLPLVPSDFFGEMAGADQDHDLKRLEIIGFRGCAKSTKASLALALGAALEHPDLHPFVVMLADKRRQASLNAASVRSEFCNNAIKPSQTFSRSCLLGWEFTECCEGSFSSLCQ
jgi:hypothetical protein